MVRCKSKKDCHYNLFIDKIKEFWSRFDVIEKQQYFVVKLKFKIRKY